MSMVTLGYDKATSPITALQVRGYVVYQKKKKNPPVLNTRGYVLFELTLCTFSYFYLSSGD